MANIAQNEVLVVLKNNDKTTKKNFINDFNNEIGEIYNDCSYEINNDGNCLELSFGSRWSEPREELEKLANKYNCEIIGVCYEWGQPYVNSFDIVPDI